VNSGRCCDRVAWLGFTTTYKTAGTAKLRGSHIRRRFCGLGCGLEKVHKLRNNPTVVAETATKPASAIDRWLWFNSETGQQDGVGLRLKSWSTRALPVAKDTLAAVGGFPYSCATFSSYSVVRERRLGTVHSYRRSPTGDRNVIRTPSSQGRRVATTPWVSSDTKMQFGISTAKWAMGNYPDAWHSRRPGR